MLNPVLDWVLTSAPGGLVTLALAVFASLLVLDFTLKLITRVIALFGNNDRRTAARWLLKHDAQRHHGLLGRILSQLSRKQ